MESQRSQAKAVGQHLLQAETPGKNGLQAVSSSQGGRALRWFTTVVLNAAFLGMVRAETAPRQAGCKPPAGDLPFQGDRLLTTCTFV